jgi:exonuclease III
MTDTLIRFAVWNANGLCQHAQEINTFLNTHNLDVLLVSETHVTERSHINIPQYAIYHTPHPDQKAHGGTAVIIRRSLKHHLGIPYSTEHIQATSVVLKDNLGELTITAVYSPPKHNIKTIDYERFFQTLGHRFIAGGDYNAKNTYWGSRITSTKGRELYKAMKKNNLHHLSSEQPTYWPSDMAKLPDLLDFCITKGIATQNASVESCLELTSDHTPIIVNMHTHFLQQPIKPSLYNKNTNWEAFREQLKTQINLKIPLKTKTDLEDAVHNFTTVIQQAAWQATPPIRKQHPQRECPEIVKQKLMEKRAARKRWHNTRAPRDKQIYNRLAKELKQLLHNIKNSSVQHYLAGLTPTDETNYSLWKATRKLKRPQHHVPPIRKPNNTWARTEEQKAETFAEHLETVFSPHKQQLPTINDDTILQQLNIPHQMALPLSKIRIQELEQIIKRDTHPTKAPGYDLITGKILKELPKKGLQAITQIYNAIFRLEYFPRHWKIGQIIMIAKPGKNPTEVTSYRPISLLPILSKILEKIILKRLTPILTANKVIPAHQFGFRQKHGTIQQTHRIIHKIYMKI